MSVAAGTRTWVEISRSALQHNVDGLRSLLSPDTVFCAVVKGNAYGHDATIICRVLLECGVTNFAVDSVDEALAIRALSTDATVFVMGMIASEQYKDCVQYSLIANIIDEESLTVIIAEAVRQQKVARINIEIETGLQRLGITLRKFSECCRAIVQSSRSVELTGLSTHLATADDVATGQTYVDQQADILREAYDMAAQSGLSPTYLHIANSAVTILRPQLQLTMIRAGIAVYGLWPSQELRLTVARGRAFELSPVLSWKTKIAQIKDVAPGSAVGYGRTFVANRPIRLAVLAVGYYDGYDRALSGQGTVLIHGRRCPIIGRICMSMCMVDVSALPHVKVGDIATLIGRDGMNVLTADDLAEKIGTIHYEVVTRINPLTPRTLV